MTQPSDLETRLRTALDDARRSQDRLRRTVLSTVLSDLHNRSIETGEALRQEQVEEVLARALKQRREAADQMREGNREDLAEKEEREAAILAEFLPPPLTEADVRARVRELVGEGIDQMGPLMARIMPFIRGRFDGGHASRIVREELEG